jgi:type I restriction enzyme S subunit
MRAAEDIKNEISSPWVLPTGWIWAPLKSLCSFIGRGRGPSYVDSKGVPVVNQKCVRWHKLEKRHLRQTARLAFDRLSAELKLEKGDILWNSTGTGTIGRAVVYDGLLSEATVDSHITIVRPESIIPEYLCYFIETRRVQHLVTDGHVGSTNQQELPRSFVQSLLVPVPPLAEQERIVARIDALFAEIYEGEAALAQARQGLETFRRALLKSAVTGELTADWRATHSSCETAQTLLELIKREKANKNIKGRARGGSSIPGAAPDGFRQLPQGWSRVSLSELSWSSSYGTSVKCSIDAKGLPVLRIPNIRSGEISYDDLKFATDDLRLDDEDYIAPGDLLVIRTNGSENLIGRGGVCITTPPQDSYFASYLIRFRLLGGECLWRWLSVYFESALVREWMGGQIASSAGQYNVSQTALAALQVPIPPQSEMKEIMGRLELALVARHETEALITTESSESARLKQSILKSAFEGRLVPQDEADKPVSTVLSQPNTEGTPASRLRAKRTRRAG